MKISEQLRFQKVSPWIKYLLIGTLIYFSLFGHLNRFTIRIWDESRLAINAFEMYENGNWIVPHFEGSPDMWSTKPPLMIWLQVFCMKMLGINELAVRLPSAIAAFLTCVILLLFLIKYLKQPWLGLIAIMVLITTHGYVCIHGSRTGDYDALLTLFTTFYGIAFFIFLENDDKKFLYITFLSITLATLTKGVAGLFFVPGLFIYILIQKKLVSILKNKHFYFGLLIFLVIVVGYYLLRESKNPGYIAAVQKNELFGRYGETISIHSGNIWYYFNQLVGDNLAYWYFMFPCGLVVGFIHKDKKYFRLTLYSSLLILTFLLIISLAGTKLEWYDIPLYPYISIIISFFIFYILTLSKNPDYIKQGVLYRFIPYLFLLLIFIYPFKKILDETFVPNETPWGQGFYRTSYFLRDAVKEGIELNNYHVVYDSYNAHILFYVKLLQKQGNNIDFERKENLAKDDYVIAQHDHIIAYIKDNYDFTILNSNENLKILKINERKTND